MSDPSGFVFDYPELLGLRSDGVRFLRYLVDTRASDDVDLVKCAGTIGQLDAEIAIRDQLCQAVCAAARAGKRTI